MLCPYNNALFTQSGHEPVNLCRVCFGYACFVRGPLKHTEITGNILELPVTFVEMGEWDVAGKSYGCS
jgi:hypothetical protein